MKELKITNQFKKDLKRYQNQPKRINKLKVVLEYLQQGTAIPQEYKPHKLLGEYKDCMECHIESDTLLIWFDENSNIVKLIRLGSHSELFK
ncbi:MAG: type II toxin-antitoxin system YafQ family toxin [Bacteroidales bacterium]|mgnify:CR=1|jgi:mRNA interferase YafQ|nr:type II toxin-antitoxin system YafQ family toxin [Bacteroidales bacterium]